MASKNHGGSDGYIPWLVILLAIGTLLFFFLRRSLIRLFPVLFILACVIPLVFYLYRRHRFRELEGIYAEYSPLVSVLNSHGMDTYIEMVNRSTEQMMKVRDRAEHIRDLVYRENAFKLQDEISELDQQINSEKDPDKKEILEKQVSEMEENLKNLEKLNSFLNQYEESKVLLANHLRNIRMKIEVGSVTESTLNEESTAEIDHIFEDVENLNSIIDRVDRISE
jgi:hypothetical protein